MKEIMRPYLDVEGVRKYLGLSQATVYRLLEKEEIPARKVGGSWRFFKDEVDQWLRERR